MASLASCLLAALACLVAAPSSAAIAVLAEVSMPFAQAQFVRLGDRAVFVADDGVHGLEPWVTDGTPAGTHLLLDLHPGPGSSAPALAPVAVNGLLLLAADDGIHGRELWRTDGTTAGTAMTVDLRPGAVGSAPDGFAGMGGHVYFGAHDGSRGRELWRSDGTAAGTAIVRDFCSGSCGTDPLGLTGASPLLFFTLGVPTLVGQELWVTDGSADGTRLVKDIRPGTASSAPAAFTAIGPGRILFAAETDESGREPWVSDGSAAGTRMVQNLNAGAWHSHPLPGAWLGDGLVLFAAYDATLYPGLWFCRPDATPACTRLRDHESTSLPAPMSIVRLGNAVHLPLHSASHGVELWRTDGTAAGTYLLRDLVAGTQSGMPRHLAEVDGALYFSAATSSAAGPLVPHPWQVWRSDGSPAGTRPAEADSWSATALGFLALSEYVVFASHHWVQDGTVFRSQYWPTAIDPRLFANGFEP